MARRWTATLLSVLALIPLAAGGQEHEPRAGGQEHEPRAGGQEREPDQISKLLFKEYLDGPRKINTSTILAASEIVADRGRTTGFWKDVLAELKSGDEHSEVHCVRILGNMLADDAAARDAIRRQKETDEVSAWIPVVYLGPEVVTELLARAKQADRNRIDHYAVALARARAPEVRALFASILTTRNAPAIAGGGDVPAGFLHQDGPRYHAAVGLAQVGEAAGYEWLIANCENPNGFVQNSRPYFADGDNLGACCRAALRQLSGDTPMTRTLTTQAEWEAWRRQAGPEFRGRAVQFEDP